MQLVRLLYLFFFFNDTATTEIYTLSLHDALPICQRSDADDPGQPRVGLDGGCQQLLQAPLVARSEEHTSELQSLAYLVCRLLLEKKKNAASSADARDSASDESQPKR